MRALFFTLLLVAAADIARCCDIGSVHNYSFRQISVNNGLSQNSVTSVFQDRQGFIWIGTYDGLNRFDGFNIQVKRHRSDGPKSLSDNRILCLQEDAQGHLLVGTDGGGIDLYDPAQDSFRRVSVQQGNLGSNIVQGLATDPNGQVWAATNKGLVILKTNGKVVERHYPAALRGVNIKCLLRDGNGNIWIGSARGLWMYPGNGTEPWNEKALTLMPGTAHWQVTAIRHDKNHRIWVGTSEGLYRIDPSGKGNVPSRITPAPAGQMAGISALATDYQGNIWVSTRGQGIYRLKADTRGLITEQEQFHTRRPFCNISENVVNTLFIDRSNTLWLGTDQKGTDYCDLSAGRFSTFYPLLSDKPGATGYEGKYISSVLETPTDLWIGAATEGLYQYDKCRNELISYKADIQAESICAVFQSKDRTIWIGASNGLYRLGDARGAKRPVSLVKGKFVARSICEDRFGNLWIATWDGVVRFEPGSGRMTQITTATGLSANSNYVVYADPYAPVVWAGTIGGGLNRIAYDAGGISEIRIYQQNEKDRRGLSSNHVWSIHRDGRSNLWIGTDAGLNRLTLSAASTVTGYEVISEPQLKDRKIVSILEARDGVLWLAGSQGLFQYNPQNRQTHQYTYRDGLQSTTMTEAAFQTADGMMYFGTINGLNYLRPGAKPARSFPTLTAFTDFRISNRPVGIGQAINGAVLLPEDINSTREITLSHRQKDFTIAFASLHYATPENNRFRYKLEGYDQHWTTTDFTQRTASYSNLDPGHYRFLVSSASGDDFKGNPVKSIRIVVKPAPWATWWAKTLYALLVAVAGLMLFNYFRTRQKLKTELFKEKLEKQKQQELNEIKLRFFTNITHEIRTPLGLILNPLQDLLAAAAQHDNFTNLRLKIIHRNAFKLYSLINQILDLRKISSNAEKLHVSEGDLVQSLLGVRESFNWMAGQKNIRFEFKSPAHLAGWFDRDKIEKIAFNLVSNAFKYTPSGGTVTLSVSREECDGPAYACVAVRDNGPGIGADEQGKIFEMYYQSEGHHSQGTGIGLSLSKSLVEMHGGWIDLDSSPGKGSEFRVTFPIDRAHFAAESIAAAEQSDVPAPATGTAQRRKKNSIDFSRKSVLLIEDNDDQREYLRDCLAPHFHVLDSAGGQEGIEIARKYQPDIVITDLMMPVIDGMGVCRELKSHAKTSHIPVIVHSIRNSAQTIREALQAGADDFIAKPFDYSVLVLKIHNILRSSNQLMLNVKNEEISGPTSIVVPSLDQELLKKIVAIVEKNMAESDFTVEKLCDEIGMSRMNLHRRLHGLIGKSASEFIREIRIKRAAQLLASGSMRISEVMDEVGISSNSHFNKYFREVYNISPKEFGQNARLN
ncbi:Signal transduction histidine kinase [Dyadobacter soli]|uniref:histidine kinase n=1 Tax=Dyadobacter soli TaxID=659014 RepID=A0A1G7VHB4_9BACT|nr:two-component regulator propeller domain-containing protein [Dyadobacter soli]SDG59087.1 Signal transduction histidine kinase [Dyadobacter soli]